MLTTILIAIAGIAAAGIMAWLFMGQKNIFIAYDPDTGGMQPMRRRTLSGSIRIKRKDGRPVRIVLSPDYARPRFDGKGSVLVANIKTGQAMMPKETGDWVSLDGIYLELAYADDTVQKIRQGTGGGYDMLKILMWLAIGNLGLLVIVVYQFAKAGGL